MTQSRFISWWRSFDVTRAYLGLAPSHFGTALWYWRRLYLPEEAAAQDFRWLRGAPGLLSIVP